MKFGVFLLGIYITEAFSVDINLALPEFAGRAEAVTVLLENSASNRRYVFNTKRASIRYSPASTFKILNTLIALEEKTIASDETVIKWDGTVHDFPDWNKDQTLRTAFKASCVWFYQQLAEKVTLKKYREYLRKVTFGNAATGKSVKTFWLDSSLKISAREQILFLKALHAQKLPFSAQNLAILRQIMLVDGSKSYRLYAKTGWVMQANPQIGWYVGYVETKDDTWFFAINLDVLRKVDLQLRQAVLNAALREAGIIEEILP